jgi:hypothetical protein
LFAFKCTDLNLVGVIHEGLWSTMAPSRYGAVG